MSEQTEDRDVELVGRIYQLLRDGCIDIRTEPNMTKGVIRFALAESQWISVKDRLPGQINHVLVPNPYFPKTFLVAGFSHGEFFKDLDGRIFPTHWMPLPEPPK